MGGGCYNWRHLNLMRHILVDFARAREVTLHDDLVVSRKESKNLVAIDDALNALEAVDARKARVVELRFFGGLSVEETAEALKVSPDTVLRDWRLAKAWLHGELNKADAG